MRSLEAPHRLEPERLGRDRVVVVVEPEQQAGRAQEGVGAQPAEERALLVPHLLRADDDVVRLEQLERLRDEVEVDRQVHVDGDQERIPRAPDELAEGEPDAALRQVEERHLPEAPAEIDAERGGGIGRSVRADQHLVLGVPSPSRNAIRRSVFGTRMASSLYTGMPTVNGVTA